MDFELVTDLVDTKWKQRPGDGDAGVIDETEERLARQSRRNLAGCRPDRGLIGHIEQEWNESAAEFGLQFLCVALASDTAEDAKAFGDKNLGGAVTNTCGCAGDDNGFHGFALGWFAAAI